MRHRASSLINIYGLNYCADHSNGKIYELSSNIFTDDGMAIIKQRDTAVIHGGLYGVAGQKLYFDEVEFIIVSGETDVSGIGPQQSYFENTYTSTLYPVYALESFDVTGRLAGADMFLFEPLEFDVVASVVSGTLAATIAFVSYAYRSDATTDEEDFDVTAEVVSGTLTVTIVYVSYAYRSDATTDEEDFDVTAEVVSGTLTIVVAYVAHTQPEEEFDVTASVVSGTLT